MHHTKYDILKMKNNKTVYHTIKLQQIHTNATATRCYNYNGKIIYRISNSYKSGKLDAENVT